MKLWQTKNFKSLLLLPFSALYFVLSYIDIAIKKNKGKKIELNNQTKIVVVGNITAGGTGKTPFIQLLANYLISQNISVAIIARGYGAMPPWEPFVVLPDSLAKHAGDEALTHAQNLNIPVVISKKRMLAIKKINQLYDVDVILSDDGLQHWQMPRHLNIVLIDGLRGFGNGWLLPAGPLRQTKAFLKQADFVFCKGEKSHHSIQPTIPSFNIKCLGFYNQKNERINIADLQNITLVSAIANPESFYKLVNEFVPQYSTLEFRDHHGFIEQDLKKLKGNIIMTEKDFVKCRGFDLNNIDGLYYCKVEATMDENNLEAIKIAILAN
ncbi:tetraacyldisaccharide 4'-kinase [Marinicellulosiphila megalodicopiae]|uniref:tetraacyldisaccharide 4'-kinase n=1 Tax=Marinicellulosiphila megalodicopiae TaxID=2724896 RepID=UPI003BB11C0D